MQMLCLDSLGGCLNKQENKGEQLLVLTVKNSLLEEILTDTCYKTWHCRDLGEKSRDNTVLPSLQCRGNVEYANNEFEQDFVYSKKKFSLPTLDSSLL